jgi:putative ABC transport system substrate-binding protein
VRDQVDLIVAFEEQALRAIVAATSALPVVFLHLVDPVPDGFVKSLAHPGGNATGFVTWAVSPSKQIELFSEFLPRLRRLMVLLDPKDAITRRQVPELRSAGAALGMQMVEHKVATASDIQRAVGATDRGKVDGVFVLSRTLSTNFPSLILRLSTGRRLPLVSNRKEWVQQGALFSYAPDLAAIGRLAAPYVTKILSGTKPGDLPVQEPTKFELVINLKTAKAHGLTLPQSLLVRADEIIE